MPQTNRTIAVIGATGRQGGQVVDHLLADGWKVRGITRSPEGRKAADLKTKGVQVVRADLEDPASLDAAMADAYGLFDMQTPRDGAIEVEIRQGLNAAAAAKRAGIRHVVYGSAGPVDRRTGIQQWDAKLEIARGMRESGLPLTVLRPMAFMELMIDSSFYPAVGVWYTMPNLAGPDCRISWLSVRDLGAIAAKAFGDPEHFVDRDLRLAADVRSIAECRDIYAEVKGRPPRRFPMPLFLFRRFVGEDLPDMWRWLRANPVDVDTRTTYEILPEAMDVRTWLQTVN